jgi:cbb3-type cytochrome oxidase cytochrome c subunit
MNRLLLSLWIVLVCTSSLFAVDPRELKPGLIAAYSDDPSKPSATRYRLEPAAAFTMPANERSYPGRKSVTWTGYLQIVTPGNYAFSATVQGGEFRLNISPPDGAKDLVAVYVPAQPNRAVTAIGNELVLAPGVYRVAASFLTREVGDSRVELLWQGPDFKREPIPYFFFGHLEKDRPKELANHERLAFGKFLFEENGCKNCHAAPAGSGLVDRTGPDLSEIGKRAYPGWLDAWLADPTAIRKQTTMPKLFADDAKGRAERFAVVQYLSSLGGPLVDPLRVPNVRDEVQSSNRGKSLFVTTGCAACHANKPNAPTKKPRDDDDPPAPFDAVGSFYGLGSSAGPQGTYDLGALGSKTQPAILANYLRDPLKTNPHGRMPAMGLNNNEVLDLARFLCRTIDAKVDRKNPQGTALQPDDIAPGVFGKPDGAFGKLSVEEKWKALGKKLIVQKGCVNCHSVSEHGKSLTAVTFQLKREDLSKNSSAGCLADKPDVAKVPTFPLTAETRSALRTFIQRGLRAVDPVGSVHDPRAAMKRFLCLNCHTKDGEGGIAAELADRMKQLGRVENLDSVQPPRLTGIGHKGRTAWLEQVLISGGRARPWMGLHMPQYGKDNVGFLPKALAYVEGTLPDSNEIVAKAGTKLLTEGRTLAGKNGHGCIACHDISGVASGGTRGPDLALTTARIRRDWFDRWMDNPQRLAPGTQMPQYYLGGKAQIPLLGGDPVKHSEAMWEYFALGPGLPLPIGLEPPKGVVIAVTDRPAILRTFMPDGAGTRAIAVGYSGGMNVAFDATQARLAYAWVGNFLDASPVWTNRGGAPAKPLGPKIWAGPNGHPWAVTDSQSPPDFAKQATDPAFGAGLPEGKAFHGEPRMQFEGYTLDAGGNPTFAYRHVDGKGTVLHVEETPAGVKSAAAAGLVRKFRVVVPAGRFAWLDAGESDKEPRVFGGKREAEMPATARIVLSQSGSKATVLDASAPSGATWVVMKKSGSGWSVLLRLGEGSSAVTITHWALPKDDDDLIRGLPSPTK